MVKLEPSQFGANMGGTELITLLIAKITFRPDISPELCACLVLKATLDGKCSSCTGFRRKV